MRSKAPGFDPNYTLPNNVYTQTQQVAIFVSNFLHLEPAPSLTKVFPFQEIFITALRYELLAEQKTCD